MQRELAVAAALYAERVDDVDGVYQHGKVTSNVATIEVQYLDPDTMPDTEVSETTYELLSDEDFNSETTDNTTTKLRR